MKNSEIKNRLNYLSSYIGKEFKGSPSPFSHWLKGVVRKADVGSIEFSYTVRKEMTNPVGTLHGGVIAGIMDDLIGVTAFSLGETTFNTSVNLNVDYFYPVQEGDEVIATTQIVKQGNTLKNIQCEVRDKNNKLIARGYSNLFRTDISVKLP